MALDSDKMQIKGLEDWSSMFVQGWYTCGPTIYSRSHLGHARTFTVVDAMVRVYRHLGVPIHHVMNITDIDDKILHRLIKRRFLEWIDGNEKCLESSPFETADQVPVAWIQENHERIPMGPVSMDDYQAFIDEMEDHFWADMKALGNERVDRVLRVSETLSELIVFIEYLIAKDKAYVANGSVYLDVEAVGAKGLPWAPRPPTAKDGVPRPTDDHEKSKAYDRSKAKAYEGEKRAPQDFALWKKTKPFEIAFDSPWGPGRPGWHIECVVMIQKAFGEKTPAVHAGGIDLRFPHHTNEWLLALAAKNPKPAFGESSSHWIERWVHVGHLEVQGQDGTTKMSQSLGNVKTIHEALDLYSPDILRMAWLMTPWSKPLVFSSDLLLAAKTSVERMKTFLDHVKHLDKTWKAKGTPEAHPSLPVDDESTTALSLDCTLTELFKTGNFPSDKAIKILLSAIDEVYTYIAPPYNPSRYFTIVKPLVKWLRIFGFSFVDAFSQGHQESKEEALLDLIVSLRDELRDTAKRTHNHLLFGLSDKIRDVYLKDLGIALEDREGLGTKAVRK